MKGKSIIICGMILVSVMLLSGCQESYTYDVLTGRIQSVETIDDSLHIYRVYFEDGTDFCICSKGITQIEKHRLVKLNTRHGSAIWSEYPEMIDYEYLEEYD